MFWVRFQRPNLLGIPHSWQQNGKAQSFYVAFQVV
jgi:hypothetical protein